MNAARFKLLLAEDDAVSRAIMKGILASDPRFEVHTTCDGGAAWELMDKDPTFDAYVLDLIMPLCGGMELVARARNDRRMAHIPVVLCSAMNDRETILRAANFGVRHYVLKPVSKTDVLRKIAAALGLKVTSSCVAPLVTIVDKEEFCDPLKIDSLQQYAEAVWLWLCKCRSSRLNEELPSLIGRVSTLSSKGTSLGAVTISEERTLYESSLTKLHQEKINTSVLLTRSDLDEFERAASRIAIELNRIENLAG